MENIFSGEILNITTFKKGFVFASRVVSEDGKVLATAPKESVDYFIQWGDDGWIKGQDGYWYHTKPVKPEETTVLLIESAYELSVPDGYRLHLQILATGVQSDPAIAVQEAWGVSVNNGELLP